MNRSEKPSARVSVKHHQALDSGVISVSAKIGSASAVVSMVSALVKLADSAVVSVGGHASSIASVAAKLKGVQGVSSQLSVTGTKPIGRG